MRIERTLADLIARGVVTESYWQHAIMATRDFARWLKARDSPIADTPCTTCGRWGSCARSRSWSPPCSRPHSSTLVLQ